MAFVIVNHTSSVSKLFYQTCECMAMGEFSFHDINVEIDSDQVWMTLLQNTVPESLSSLQPKNACSRPS